MCVSESSPCNSIEKVKKPRQNVLIQGGILETGWDKAGESPESSTKGNKRAPHQQSWLAAALAFRGCGTNADLGTNHNYAL